MDSINNDVPESIFKSEGTEKSMELFINKKDKHILRELGKHVAEIGEAPVNAERKEEWRKLNELEYVKPMVWLNEVCWNEMNVENELLLQTTTEFSRGIETWLQRIIYSWKHMPCDMIVDPFIASPLIIENTGVGIKTEEDVLPTDESNVIVSHRFHPQIRNEEDIEKIKLPKIIHHEKMTQQYYNAYRDIFDGVLPVEKRGVPGFWFAPWDEIVSWTGVQEALIDLIMRPDYIHKIVDRLLTAHLHSLDQYENLNLLSLNNNNVRIGSGAYGYTGELPQPDHAAGRVRAADIWGAATAQIFSEVSPEMHEEFALQYERRWLERFGLTYYGCCEPLHNKIDILKSIPNLRKISISPWVDMEEAAEKIGKGYVVSLKPNPAVLAPDTWDLQAAKRDLEEKLTIARAYSCPVEIIMKDISTVHYKPQRLWQWAEMASEVSERYG
jgi:hypothetical protein